jgi:hypothetical protein
MLKVIGAVTLVGGIAFGAAYFGGYVDGKVDAQVTPKGRQAAADGLREVQNGISTGLGKAAEAVAPPSTPR